MRRWRVRRPPRSLGVALGLGLDRVLGEPPIDPHPLVVFGRLMEQVESRLYADSRARGVVHTGIGVGIGVAAGMVLRSPALATYVAVGGRSLAEAADAVRRPLVAGDLDAARAALPALVGRDPARLDEVEIARAVVESVAENTVDAVVAPVLWAVVGGAPGALGYRAVNTLDAMVGRRSDRYERYGWASARLDDVANLVPARATAALVGLVRPHRAAAVLGTVRRDGRHHPSPNAGVAEAAFAAALGIQLGGTNRYGDRVEERPALGQGRRPTAVDIGRATALSRDVAVALAAVLVGAWVSPTDRRR
jgi:adenosylcobinamide-phosphate synthase